MSERRNPISPSTSNNKNERRMQHHAAMKDMEDIDEYVFEIGENGIDKDESMREPGTSSNSFRATAVAGEETDIGD